MTLVAPWRLILIALPAAVAVAYVVAQRARQRTAVRFTSVDMLASVAPRRPGWQRHLAAGLLAASMFSLVVSFAHPARVTRTPKQKATVVLTLDVSGSMVATDVAPNRLAAAKRAATAFVEALPSGVQLGVVSFSTNANVLVAPTSDRSTVLAAIDGLRASGATATGPAIDLALKAIATVPPDARGKQVPAAIVLMSDGTPTQGRPGDMSPAAAVASATMAARQSGVKINTIAFGTADGQLNVGGRIVPVPSDPSAMAQIASDTGGSTFTADSAGKLTSVYKQIGRAVGYDVHRRDIAPWFTVLAFALALTAALAGIVWAQRVL